MPSCCLYLAAAAGVLLAAAAAAVAAVVPQVQTVKAAPGSSVRVDCGGSSASGGSGWTLLGTLSNLLLGEGDDDDDDGDAADSSGEQRADSEEDYYSWMDMDLLGDTSSEEAARREPSLPGEPANSSLLGEPANNSLPRYRRAAPSWSLGDIDVQAGKNWSVRVFNWVLVRRDPATDRVEVKLLMPNLFSSGASDDDDDLDDNSSAPGTRATPQAPGDIDVQGGKNWSVRVFNWVLVRRNPATGEVEVKLQVPGLFSPTGGGGGDYIDDVEVTDGGREARSTRFEAGAARLQEDGSRRLSSPEGHRRESQPTAS